MTIEIKPHYIDDQGPWWGEDNFPGEQSWNIVVSEWTDKFGPFIKTLPRKGTAIQAGAWQGLYPILLAQMYKNVICFEPDLKNYAVCVKNLENKDNIKSFNCALGSRSGTAKFETTRTSGQHRIRDENFETYPIQTLESINIDIKTIDSLELPECDLIMLDVENYELPVIEGALTTIQNFLPVIIFEKSYWPNRDHSIEKHLTKLGYRKTHDWERDVIYQHSEVS